MNGQQLWYSGDVYANAELSRSDDEEAFDIKVWDGEAVAELRIPASDMLRLIGAITQDTR